MPTKPPIPWLAKTFSVSSMAKRDWNRMAQLLISEDMKPMKMLWKWTQNLWPE